MVSPPLEPIETQRVLDLDDRPAGDHAGDPGPGRDVARRSARRERSLRVRAIRGALVLALGVSASLVLVSGAAATTVGRPAGRAYADAGGFDPGSLLVAGLVLASFIVVVGVLLLHRFSAREREASARELRLRDRALAASPDGIVITDALQDGGPVVFVNPAFTTLTGWTAAELIGKPYPLLRAGRGRRRADRPPRARGRPRGGRGGPGAPA